MRHLLFAPIAWGRGLAMRLNLSASASFPAPCVSSRAARRILFCAAASLLALCGASGCGLQDESAPATHGTAPSSSATTFAGAQRKKNTKNAGAVSGSTQSAWTRALFDWMQGGTQGAPSATPGAAPQQAPGVLGAHAARGVVYVDVAALARRHPAWRLAAALETGRNADSAAGVSAQAPGDDLQPAFPSLSAVVRASAGSQPDWGAAASRTVKELPRFDTAPADHVGGGSAVFAGAARHQEAAGVAELNRRAGRHQNAALRQFLALTEAHQDAAREALATDLRDALLENAATSRRATLSPLAPTLPDAATQLEMTNLRLRLENPRLPVAEKERARLRLSALEARWRNVLRGQEETVRRSEMARQNEAQPRRLDKKDEARIAALMSSLRDHDAVQREAAGDVLQARWQQDFGAGQAISGLTMPGFAFSPPSSSPPSASPRELVLTARRVAPFQSGARNRASAGGGATATWENSAEKPDKTFVGHPASVADFWPGDAAKQVFSSRLGAVHLPALEQHGTRADSGDGRTAQIRALRARALREARLWAAVAARRGGWQWRESTLRQRDSKRAAQTVIGTRATLRILNLS